MLPSKGLLKTRSLYLAKTFTPAALVQRLQRYSQQSSTTTGDIKMPFEVEKLKFLSMPSEEKRALYRKIANKNVVTLHQIPTWFEYWNSNKSCMKKSTWEEVGIVEHDLAKKVSLWSGDITSLEVDAIVNAANRSLRGGGGVDGAIHKMAGPSLKQESMTMAPCGVGEVRLTGAYALPANYVIHTVGPQDEEPNMLSKCYEQSLVLAQTHGFKSIAFPCISTGVYGFPQYKAAAVALGTVKKFLEDHDNVINRVIFCVFLDSDKTIYEELLQKFFALE
ncbi:macro domain-containing protein CT2219-like isoform X1 [Neodiprion fabricii]|uniref:macro domain-containing protein CT2219-like isoform X1 n=2 Tax=Neodiprion fabricii TaxID=2872261 RepID=UPI001ED97E23|nr:macro domain-containing protein CT2219-like isoform X1 [Neodiprion fabricii]